MANQIVSVHAGIYGMGIYAIMLPSSGFSVAHYSYLSTGWGVTSFCGSINLRYIANQTTHSLKSLAQYYGYVYVRPSRRISGL